MHAALDVDACTHRNITDSDAQHFNATSSACRKKVFSRELRSTHEEVHGRDGVGSIGQRTPLHTAHPHKRTPISYASSCEPMKCPTHIPPPPFPLRSHRVLPRMLTIEPRTIMCSSTLETSVSLTCESTSQVSNSPKSGRTPAQTTHAMAPTSRETRADTWPDTSTNTKALVELSGSGGRGAFPLAFPFPRGHRIAREGSGSGFGHVCGTGTGSCSGSG